MSRGAKTKGFIKNTRTGKVKKFIYNPSSFTQKRNFNYTEITAPGCAYPKFQFVNGEAKSIDIELFVRGKHKEVQSYIEFLNGFMPSENSNKMFSQPPQLIFSFGNFIKKCILVGYDEDNVDFDKNLNRTTVKISLSLKVVA